MDRGLGVLGGLLCLALGSGCGDSTAQGGGPAEGGGGGSAGAPSQGGNGGAGGGESCVDTDLPEEDLGVGEDPEAGVFTLEEALDGLPEGPGPLRAIIETDLGTLTCELFPDVAPNGVANFVGLARGRRPFEQVPGNHWIKGRHFYDGLKFHRVIDDFMAQGGDPRGTGSGGPGYAFDDELGGDGEYTPGTLAYANSGPDTNGSQFFIVAETGAPTLPYDYVIFGRCAEVDVVQALTEVETSGPPSDTPLTDLHMTSVRITRCAP